MSYPKLYVAFFRPQYGNYQHWGLFLDDDEEQLMFEVLGEHPNFERNVEKQPPEQLEGFLRRVYVAVISKTDIETVKQVAQTVPVDNETVEWDCQEYVLDMLDRLEDECVLDRDDEDYQDARETLRERRGAMG